MAQSKFYAVKEGREVGIFETWAECQAQVHEFRGAKFKSFTTREQAEAWLCGEKMPVPAGWVAYTDGSPRRGGAILLYDGEEVARAVEVLAAEGDRHNVAELKGIELAVRLAREHQAVNLLIFTDSNNALSWLTAGWQRNDADIDRAVAAIEELLPPDVRFAHVRGHQHDYWNEEVDRLVSGEQRIRPRAY